MDAALQTRHVLALLKEQGIPTHREELALVSDALGLKTREDSRSLRRWTDDQVRVIARAFEIRRTWRLRWDVIGSLVSDGRFPDGLEHDLQALRDDTVRLAPDDVAAAPDDEDLRRLRRLKWYRPPKRRNWVHTEEGVA